MAKWGHYNLGLLKLLDSRQLLQLNELLYDRYKTEMIARQHNSQFIIDEDDGVPLSYFHNV